jgi:urea carboxylase system permease
MAVAEPPRGPASGGSSDVSELAKFGYKQELDRSLGSFSSFAAGFSYISILTGVFQLFAFGFLNAGPAVWWSWLLVFFGQFMVALCFAEMAGQYPLAGSVYQWSKRMGSDFSSWMTGWIMIIGSIVTVAAVAVAWQVILPQISTKFQFVGTSADAGLYSTPEGAKNAIILATVLVVFTTVINMLGVRVMARINNAGVFLELVGCTVLVILLAINITRGPGIVLHNFGTGAGHDWNYLGAFLIGGIMSAYVMYGFDTAGTLAEETNEPRRNAPPAILRALVSAGILGGLLILFALMSVSNVHDEKVGTLGLPFIVKDVLGNTAGNVFLWDSAIAIAVCALAVHTAAIRMLFSMARDDRLPAGDHVARVSGNAKVPIVPALLVGGLTLVLLVANLANQKIFTTLTSVAIIMFYLAYLGVTLPMLLKRMRGEWPTKEHGPFFSLGRWGLLVNAIAVVYGTLAVINIGWPRAAVYSNEHWYFQYGAVVFIGLCAIVGGIYYFAVQRKKADQGPLARHRADLDLSEPPLAEVAP